MNAAIKAILIASGVITILLVVGFIWGYFFSDEDLDTELVNDIDETIHEAKLVLSDTKEYWS